jgi:hypothetical protein
MDELDQLLIGQTLEEAGLSRNLDTCNAMHRAHPERT